MNEDTAYNIEDIDPRGTGEHVAAFSLLRENGLEADISERRALLSLLSTSCVRRSDARSALPAPPGCATRQGLYTATPALKHRIDPQGRLIRIHPDGTNTIVGRPKHLSSQARREACRQVGLVLVKSPILTDPGDFGDGDCALRRPGRREEEAAATPLTPETCPELSYHERQRGKGRKRG